MFLKDNLSSYQFKYLLSMVVSMFTPLVSIGNEPIELGESFLEGIEMLSS